MKIIILILFTLGVILYPGCNSPTSRASGETAMTKTPSQSITIPLPPPTLSGSVSLEEALSKRRSIRSYSDMPLSLNEISQLLWAAQGITESWGGRTAPSAGGLYPLEVYLAAGNVDKLASGEYKYIPEGHKIELIKEGDIRSGLAKAALDQSWVREGSVVIVIAGVYQRTTQKYGDRGIRYVDMEAGHAAQNVCLQATALGLGAVTVGAFYDDQVGNVLGSLKEETPLYLIPVGKK